jgi:ketosteroid isomerase-like protein
MADDIGINVQGDVAWPEGHGRFTMAGGGEQPMRMTTVLFREDGRWKVVQSHASIGVLNADILG